MEARTIVKYTNSIRTTMEYTNLTGTIVKYKPTRTTV